MAAITSLGVHTPVALPYLVAEGLLPPNPKAHQYQWDTYLVHDGGEEVEEEILATADAVVWSQGKFIRNVYRFTLDGESVVQAVLTRFPVLNRPINLDVGRVTNGNRESRVSAGFSQHLTSSEGDQVKATLTDVSDRALVVLLKSKAHIYFLRGSSHILDLPFEVKRAFAAPRGLILQRNQKTQRSVPPTSQIPAAPPNSFWSSQGLPGSSLRNSLSPTLVRSFAKPSSAYSKPPQQSLLAGNPKLDALFQDLIVNPSQRGEEDVTNLYCLSDPFSDLGVVTYSLQHHKPRISGKLQSGLNVEFEGLDPGEQVIYVTPDDEIASCQQKKSGPLMLLVTFNADLSTITLWHAWYIEERSLQALLKIRADQKEAKARRRSSFASVNAGTGAATPALRRRDGTRESFIGPSQLQGDVAASQSTTLSRKPTQQEAEEALASQMDPDYIPVLSQQPVRESRRISSMNTDVRASQTTVNASFGAAGGRRATSFGGTQGRRSLSHRKSRGSTPGSAYGASLGGDDESMDLDSTNEFDADESVEDILRHIQATFEASGTDSVFGNIEEGFKREVVVRKIYSFPVGLSTSSQGRGHGSSETYKAVVMSEPCSLSVNEDTRVKVYVHDRDNCEVQCVLLKVKQRPLWPQTSASPVMAIPVLIGEVGVERCEDVLKLQHGHVTGVLIGSRGIQFSLDENTMCPLPRQASYRVYNGLDPLPRSEMDEGVGKNRILSPPSSLSTLHHSGLRASYDEVTVDGVHHRRRLQLHAEDPQVERLLSICEIVLPHRHARIIRRTWCVVLAWLDEHPETMASTACDSEFVALVSTVFVFVIALLDSKARAALNLSKVAVSSGKSNPDVRTRLRRNEHDSAISASPIWSWMPPPLPTSGYTSVNGVERRRDYLLVVSAAVADEVATSILPASENKLSTTVATTCAIKLMLAFHIYREEQKLCKISHDRQSAIDVAPLTAQLGLLLNLDAWAPGTGRYYEYEGATEHRWAFVRSKASSPPQMRYLAQPVGVFQWFEHSLKHSTSERYPALPMVAQIGIDGPIASGHRHVAEKVTPRIITLSNMLALTNGLSCAPTRTLELLVGQQITIDTLESFPEAMAAPFREAISLCEREPPTTWQTELLKMVGRGDLVVNGQLAIAMPARSRMQLRSVPLDIQTACHASEHPFLKAKTREAGRHSVSQLIFSEDRRLVEATSLMHFNSVQVAQCPKQPDWDEMRHFEHQRKVMHWVTIRMIALPAGDGMLHYDSQTPLLTEKYHLPGFSSSCLMQPMGHTLTADRTGLTEEKVNWAYFHAGVSTGLRISRNAKGIDTSWIAFNKPPELQNRHAGLLFALGLGGHLRRVAKWLLFKYLTPKHTMTSVGLLLGLSASYIGTMDGLVTRMLSVHITRMLPAGAAELNVTPATQAAGMMGIGLLYYNTQHRRMSEVMLSEIEFMEMEDPDSGPDPLRDESYRLSTGFALGLINLGNGNDLRGLHGMSVPERLLAVAIGPRPVNAVHVFDRATAGAVVAITLIYMKSSDRAIAKKIDIPDTEAQFDQVRPDILMLRAMAKHIILWDNIEAKGGRCMVSGSPSWIRDNLPLCYKDRAKEVLLHKLNHRTINSIHIPLFNVYTGLAWALALRYAGTGNELARNEILELLGFFHTLMDGAGTLYFADKLGRSALKRCVDVLALSAAIVMAGTGDIETFRYLRRMHGRTDADTPYGSHLAAHMAIGVLFLGGGTFTFGTTNLAIAALICAFYPLFPTDVHDNRVHLQAFRHLWVLAVEARCIVIEDIDTRKPFQMPILVTMRNGSKMSMKAPCLLPELGEIATVQTDDPAYWRVTLDFAGSPMHLASFRKDQRVFVRRCPAADAHGSVFSAALAALNDTQTTQAACQQVWHTLFNLRAFKDLDRADVELLLPPETSSMVYSSDRATVVDDRMTLSRAVSSSRRDELWNLRILFAWAEKAKSENDGKLRWIAHEIVEALKARVEERARSMST